MYDWDTELEASIGHLTPLRVEQDHNTIIPMSFDIQSPILMVDARFDMFHHVPVNLYSFGRWVPNRVGAFWMTNGNFRCDPAGFLQSLANVTRFRGGKMWK